MKTSMKKKRRRKRSPPKVSRYRRVVGRLSHSMLAVAVVTVGLSFGLASVGWAVDGKPLLAGRTNTETQAAVLQNNGAGSALDLRAGTGTPALAVNTAGLVDNLNADLLDGKEAAAFAEDGHKHSGADITSGTVGESFIDDAITRDSEVPSLVGDSFATQSALNEERAEREAADIVIGSHTKQTRTALVTSLSNSTGEKGGPRQTVARLPLSLPGNTQQALQQAVKLDASLMLMDSMGPEHGCPCEFSMDIFDATNQHQVGEVNQTFYGIDGDFASWTMNLTALNVAAFPGSRTYELRPQVFDRAGTVDNSFHVGRVSLISQTIPYKD